MASTAVLVFPHQLFQHHPSIQTGIPVYLVEETLFFRQYHFHQLKLVLHRASMQWYAQWLQAKGHTVHYIACTQPEHDCRKLIPFLAAQKIDTILIADVADNWLRKRTENSCKQCHIHLQVMDSPNFMNTVAQTDGFFSRQKKYFQTDFYIWQRKQRNLLLEKNGTPTGGKWSFDAENRMRFPAKNAAPLLPLPDENNFIREARTYIQTHFPKNPGNALEPLLSAVNFEDAQQWLSDFLIYRFEQFGIYEDAIVAREHVLHHSVLTPMLNIGLLSPQQIIEAALHHAKNHSIPLNSLEGFIRQITGWREFIHLVYEREGVQQRTTNYWNFKRKIPPSFWNGTTGIEPIDQTIKKVLKTGYCHHIERLMILGNFMLLCEFDPDEVYHWFMELFIDAYDWVMVPNVYGMTQFADGGLMTTKPYISGSNYIIKMSDYPKGNWQQVWDGLFWRFMHIHRNFFSQNPRLGMLLNTFDKMDEMKRQAHLHHAALFLQQLDDAFQ